MTIKNEKKFKKNHLALIFSYIKLILFWGKSYYGLRLSNRKVNSKPKSNCLYSILFMRNTMLISTGLPTASKLKPVETDIYNIASASFLSFKLAYRVF